LDIAFNGVQIDGDIGVIVMQGQASLLKFFIIIAPFGTKVNIGEIISGGC